jgi:signal transduction histidine kinase
VSAAVAQFTLIGLVVTLALAALTGVLARRAGEQQATRAFEQLAQVTAAALSPGLDANPADADPVQRAALRRQVDALRASGPVVRVRVWDTTGRVLWADDPQFVGTVAPLDEEATRALRSGQVTSSLEDDVSQDPSVAGLGELIAAYVPVRDPDGTPLLVELFERQDAVADAARATWLRFTPAALGALVLLQLVQVPLAWRLARRLRKAQEAQAALLQAAVGASEAERRRIAGEVHDHVVQDLTGLAYDLDAARLRGDRRTPEDAALVARTAESVRRSIADLRSLLVRLTPPRSLDGGLSPALRDLGRRLEREGTQVRLETDGVDDLPGPAAALIYRCAQEALRNVATHSRAETVEVSVRRDDDGAVMVVDDDGCGFDEEHLASRGADGHLGLRALGHLVADAGGSFMASSAPGQGTRLVVTVPLDPDPSGAGAAR